MQLFYFKKLTGTLGRWTCSVLVPRSSLAALSVYRKHGSGCARARSKSTRDYWKRPCPIWVQGRLRDRRTRKSFDRTNRRAAPERVRRWGLGALPGARLPGESSPHQHGPSDLPLKTRQFYLALTQTAPVNDLRLAQER